MIVVNKNDANVNLIFTITENITIPSSGLLLKLHSAYDSKEYDLLLGDNESAHQDRYDLFTMEGTVFNQMRDGQYYYTIIQQDDLKVLEIGLLELKSNTDAVEYVSRSTADSHDDSIVYEG